MKVSNSQIASLQKCEKRFEYEHIDKLRPHLLPEAMERGIDGHELLEEFFKGYAENMSYEEGLMRANVKVAELLARNGHVNIYRHVLAFGAWVAQQKLAVVECEVNHLYLLPDGNTFAFTPDLVLQWTDGVNKGRKFMVDTKFTGQYWTDREIAQYQQVPKYIAYYNKENPDEPPMRHGAVVMLNTRASVSATGQQLFMIKWLEINKKKLTRIVEENEILIGRVVEARSGTRELMRSVDTYGCKMCPYSEDLCHFELNGHDTTRTRAANYIYNTYFDENYGDQNGQEAGSSTGGS